MDWTQIFEIFQVDNLGHNIPLIVVIGVSLFFAVRKSRIEIKASEEQRIADKKKSDEEINSLRTQIASLKAANEETIYGTYGKVLQGMDERISKYEEKIQQQSSHIDALEEKIEKLVRENRQLRRQLTDFLEKEGGKK